MGASSRPMLSSDAFEGMVPRDRRRRMFIGQVMIMEEDR